MRNPKIVLDNLSSHATKEHYVFEKLYRNLYNPEFYYLAYQKMYAKEGNLTAGVNDKTIDGMNVDRIAELISQLKAQTYQPTPVKRVYIPKKNGNKRPLGIPSFEDKLIQEIVKNILEAIYEKHFSTSSHGFRPNKSCHTALMQCKNTFNGVKWFIEGDIKSFFDHIHHHILIKLLRRNIKDEKFINLIWKFLRAGYVENWVFHNTYSGTPQGGIISPILANIYLNELDTYIEKYKLNFDRGQKRRQTKQYGTLHAREMTLKRKCREHWHTLDEKKKQEIKKKCKEISSMKRAISQGEPMDENYKRLQYVRYADDFILGVIGSKEEAIRLKEDIHGFLRNHLGLELSLDKTLITHSSKAAKFLSYDIKINRSLQVKKTKRGYFRRTQLGVCHLQLSKDIWFEKLLALDVLFITKENTWKPKHRAYLITKDDLEILSIYNAEIRGLYNYFKLACNVSTLNNFKYIMEYSMYKTFAAKYKTSIGKIRKKYNINGKFAVTYKTKNGMKTRFLYHEGFQWVKSIKDKNINIDEIPNTLTYTWRTSLTERLLAEKCEWCESKGIKIHIHHIRKLKDLKGKKLWEQQMIARQRKTLALCEKCHRDLHAGRLDG
ncbi:reverse transcriptase domain-containing protein [Bacillus toyonensis]|uniref:reverse transcriptase/maturase family protein n=1 Tax=Bacillus toyonensis TaxID=155322 RepID=UPI00346553B0